MHKGSVYLRVSVIPLIVLALFGLLFTGAVPTEDDTVFITIVHTNDVHGRGLGRGRGSHGLYPYGSNSEGA